VFRHRTTLKTDGVVDSMLRQGQDVELTGKGGGWSVAVENHTRTHAGFVKKNSLVVGAFATPL